MPRPSELFPLEAVNDTFPPDVNVRLAHLVYRGDPNWHGVDDLTITVTDAVGHPDGAGAGGSHTVSRTVLVDVAAVNDPPALHVAGTTGRHDFSPAAARHVDEAFD